MTRLCLENISVEYNSQKVLDRVCLEVETGSNLAVIGRSGSGKSTLLRVIAGLEPPASGLVLSNDEVLSEPGHILIAPERRRMAMVFQDLGLWPNLDAEQNVRLGLSGLRLKRAQARRRTTATLERCGVAQLAHRLPGTLSGGEQQRVALARALAVEPVLLLLDEPFTGLDLVTREDILQEVERLAREQAVTLVVVTHDPSEAERLCDVAVVLEAGQVVGRGPLGELVRNSTSPIMARYRANKAKDVS
ncbi:MAG: ATP-binding cassette domain-containing protein [bacterium]|nr:ATP-binding cassette domain-containing protein [bacterium]